MGGVLNVMNDRPDDFELEQANIFTPDQGICLQRLEPKNGLNFKFDHGLAYGSWYDIQIIGRDRCSSSAATTSSEPQRYLNKGIYLSCCKAITVSELTTDENFDHGARWECGSCKKPNVGSVALCEHCYTNRSQTIISALSRVPIIGVPFSITNAVLQCGKAAQSSTTADQVDAGFSVVCAAIDVVTAPFIIGALVEIPAKVAAETGIKLTVKNAFGEAGKSLLSAAGEELAKGEIATGVQVLKVVLEKLIKNVDD